MISFDDMTWEADRLRWRGLIFRLEDPARPVPGDDGLVLWKTEALVEQYRAFWAERPGFSARQVFEVGLWKGGSVAFWAEALQPERLVGVDLREASGSPVFESYLAAHAPRLAAHWAVDQLDQGRLRALVESAFEGPLDLVIDDASHLYAPTRASFEALFPLLRPGGLYVIEDWAWAHWPRFQGSASPFARQIPLTRLVDELVAATGSGDMVRAVSVRRGFVAVERGPRPTPEPFTLDAAISWPVRPPRSLRRLLGELVSELVARLRAGRIRG
ncbi:MAG: class I SAM-dependent methyltransferase [Candidatus Rokuibacteriota bacterium]